MRTVLCLLILWVLAAPATADLIVTGGQVFDTPSGTFVANRGIVVRGGRFFELGADPAAHSDLERVELAPDDFILPGLVDLHAHYNVRLFEIRRDETQVQPVVYLANGVTTTFPAGEYDPDDMQALREAIGRGDQLGPRLLGSGPYYGSVRPGWSHEISDDELMADIDAWAARGVSGFKAKGIRAKQLRTLIERAHHHGLTVTGHLGSGSDGSVNPKDAILMGIDRIEHFLGGDALPASRSAYESLENLDPDVPEVDAIIEFYVAHNVTFDATMSAYGYFGHRKEGYDYWIDEREFFTPYVQTAVAEREPEVIERFEKIYWIKRKTLKKYFDAGGTVSLGTDHFSSGEFLPGFSAHRELDAFVRSGIPPADAIRIGTINSARAIGMGDRLGSIEPGKLADLMVIKGDPLADIRATRTVHRVMKAGKFYKTKDLLDSVKGKLGPKNASQAVDW